jgi:8-oxo-dGTP pyrophosphatase MutT (NUDIX family)
MSIKPVLLDLAAGNVHRPSTVDVIDRAFASQVMQPAALAVVVDDDGRVLAVSRPEPPYEMALPGGHVESGESPVRAAARELAEETGIRGMTRSLGSGWSHLGDIVSPTDGRKVSVFRAHGWTGTASALEPNTRIAWMTPDDLLAQSVLYRSSVKELMAMGAFAPRTPMERRVARMKARRSMNVSMISAEKRKSLPEAKFALPGTRKYPIDTAARTRNAAARLEQAKKAGRISDADYAEAKGRIAAAAKRFGIDSQYNESDNSFAAQAHAQVHVRVDGLAHGGSIHVRHMTDGSTVVVFPPIRVEDV